MLSSHTIPCSPFLLCCDLSHDCHQSGLPDTNLNPPLTLSRTHKPWPLRPSSRPLLLVPVTNPRSSICIHSCFLDSSPYLIYLENTYFILHNAAQRYLLCDAFLGHSTSPNPDELCPSLPCALHSSSNKTLTLCPAASGSLLPPWGPQPGALGLLPLL